MTSLLKTVQSSMTGRVATCAVHAEHRQLTGVAAADVSDLHRHLGLVAQPLYQLLQAHLNHMARPATEAFNNLPTVTIGTLRDQVSRGAIIGPWCEVDISMGESRCHQPMQMQTLFAHTACAC